MRPGPRARLTIRSSSRKAGARDDGGVSRLITTVAYVKLTGDYTGDPGSNVDQSDTCELIGMFSKPALGAMIALGLSAASALGESASLPMAVPETVGIDPQRLGYLENFIKEGVENGETPGAVLLVARSGKIVLHEAYGERNPATKEPMTRDSIFRIFSMGKGLAAAASLRLIERGELRFDGALSDYLPEFKNMRVVNRNKLGSAPGTYATAEAVAQINVADLLRHSAGFGGYNFYPGYIGDLFRKAGIGGQDLTLAEATERAAKIPLLYQPGTTFSYAETSYNTLGNVLEKTQDKPLKDVMQAEIFGPLGMVDTGFEVPEDKADRLTERMDTGRNATEWFDAVTPRKFHSPATGMTSTAADYWRFIQMLLDEGIAPTGEPVMAPSSVDVMLSDNVSGLKDGLMPKTLLSSGWSWGLGLFVNLPDKPAMIIGGVDGGLFMMAADGGTAFIASRKQDFVAILMNPQLEYLKKTYLAFANLALQTIGRDAGGAD